MTEKFEQGGADQPEILDLLQKAVQHHQAGELVAAQKIYEQLLENCPQQTDTLYLLATVKHQQNELQQAESLLLRLLEVQPENSLALNSLGLVQQDQGNLTGAEQSFRQSIFLKPDFSESYYNLGVVLLLQRRLVEANRFFEQSLVFQPQHAAGHYNQGLVYQGLGKLDLAAQSYSKAIHFRPDFIEAYNNLGRVLNDLGRLDQAIEIYHKGLSIRADSSELFNNLGTALKEQRKLPEAISAFRSAINLTPGYASAHLNLGMALLQYGEFMHGLDEYEWRWELESAPSRKWSQPLWDGAEIPGKTLLVYAEQGFGDTLQFMRYFSLLQASGVRIIFETLPGLERVLLKDVELEMLFPRGGAVHIEDLRFDYRCPLLSLPRLFNTRIETIPASVPYLSVDEESRIRWRAKIGDLDSFKVGLVWQGREKFDHNDYANPACPIQNLILLAGIPDVSLYSLQKGDAASDLKEKIPTLAITDLSSDLTDFAETAAAIAQLNLVICVDTAVAHLAGGLGVEVWTLLPYACDWRWLEGRSDSPWYPSMRLFRSSEPGDWQAIMAKVREVLVQRVEQFHSNRQQSDQLLPESDSHSQVNSTQHLDISNTLQAWLEKAIRYQENGDLLEAQREYSELLTQFPDNVHAHHNLGLILQRQNKTDAAIQHFQAAIRSDDQFSPAHASLGVVYYHQKLFGKAIRCLSAALKIEPDNPHYLNNLAAILKSDGQVEEALVLVDRAISIAPDFPEAHNNRGNVLKQMDRPVQAQFSFEKALQLQPNNPQAMNNLGIVLQASGKPHDAINQFERAIQLDPSFSQARFNLGIAQLLTGEYEKGWQGYEWGLKTGQRPQLVESCLARWDGTDTEHTLVVCVEQGIGDTLQFSRFLEILKHKVARLVLVCQPELSRLLSNSFDIEVQTALGGTEQYENHAVVVNLLSVPALLGITFNGIPNRVPYLKTDGESVAWWKSRLGQSGDFRIGIVWAGNPRHENDRNRSIQLSDLAPLFSLPGVKWYSLQKGSAQAQLQQFEYKQQIENLDSAINNWADTAAVIENLDLVITVDTAVAHLAGSLGKPVWTLVSCAPDWRWMLDREDSPWYPSMRLFRQIEQGSWEYPINAIRDKLEKKLGIGFTISQEATQFKPNLEEKIHQGLTHHQNNELDQAQEIYQEILEYDPDHQEALFLLGTLKLQQNDYQTARQLLEQRLRLGPETAELHYNLGLVYRATKQMEESRQHLIQAINLRADYSQARNALAKILIDEGKVEQAIEQLELALRNDPHNIELHYSLGNGYLGTKDYSRSMQHFRAVVVANPNHEGALLNLANLLRLKGELSESQLMYEKVLKINPSSFAANNGLGSVFDQQGCPDEAIRLFKMAIRSQPRHWHGHFNLSQVLLRKGEWPQGWMEFEWRLQDPGLQRLFPDLPRWDGSDLNGKRILVCAEQGYGDSIQFSRYLEMVSDKGGKVTFQCQVGLGELMKSCSGIEKTVETLNEEPIVDANDFYIPLLSLPGMFSTCPDTIPNRVPYLQPKSATVQIWDRLQQGSQLNVGLVWAGDPNHQNDRNRSIAWQEYIPLLQVAGVQFFGLQKNAQADALQRLGSQVSPFEDLQPALTDFEQAAAIISKLDLLITVDTALAHLAGALNIPVWMLLPHNCDWRWLENVITTDWYPSMCIFRQDISIPWSNVVQQVLVELQHLRDSKRSSEELPALENVDNGFDYHKKGNLTRAEQIYRSVMDQQPDHIKARFLLANLCLQKGGLDEAEEQLNQVLASQPNNAQAYHSMGLVLKEKGDLEWAARNFRQALAHNPALLDALFDLALVEIKLDHLDCAKDSLNQFLQQHPEHADANFNLGLVYQRLERFEEAIQYYEKALEIYPDFVQAHNNLGLLLQAKKQLEPASEHFHRAHALAPESAEILRNLGMLLQDLGEYEQALDRLQLALELDPSCPDSASNLGAVLQRQGKLDEAEAVYIRALEHNPDSVPLINNLGTLYQSRGWIKKALEHYQHAVDLQPDHVDAHFNLAIAHLLRGEYSDGWKEYEWRLKRHDVGVRSLSGKRWEGEDIQGKRILVYAEQGFGDTFQFVRFLSLLKNKGAFVVFECQIGLAALLSNIDGIDQLIDWTECGDEQIPYDLYCPLMSLPGLLDITLEKLPLCQCYIQPEQQRVSYWQEKIGTEGFRVGIVWAGRPTHLNDQNRSCGLQDYSTLIEMHSVRWISLQKDGTQVFQDNPNLLKNVLNLDRDLTDFGETAAVIANLDLVITVDTSIAHLAGAIGKPVWTLLPFAPDWRWMLRSTETPWYPNMRLYRQLKAGDWNEVFDRLKQDLKTYIHSGNKIN